MPEVVSKYNPLKNERWAAFCESWSLLEDLKLSVKLEMMATGTSEQLHYHQESQQFFYILAGIATFEVDDEQIEVHQNEGLHIRAGQKHRIFNNGKTDLEFLLCSQPSIVNDRINI